MKYRVKNKIELAADRKYFRMERGIKFLRPILYSISIFLLMVIPQKIGLNGWDPVREPISWGKIFEIFPITITMSLGLGFFIYYFPYILGKPIFEENKCYVCLECGKRWEQKDKFKKCSRSGTFKEINKVVEINKKVV